MNATCFSTPSRWVPGLLFCLFALEGMVRADPPWMLWKPGDGFLIEVDYFPKPKANTPPDAAEKITYPLHVIVMSEGKLGNTPCWKLGFVSPSPASKAVVPNRHQLWVRKDNGQPLTVYFDKKHLIGAVVSFESESFVALFPVGVPLELPSLRGMTEIKSSRFMGSSGTLQISTRDAAKEKQWEAVISMPDQPEVIVRQTWTPGEKWWSHYERIRGGHTELVARRPGPTPVKDVPQKAIEVTKKEPETPKSDLPGELEKDRFNLRKDPALAAGVTWNHAKPTVREVLEQLASASGLAMTASEEKILNESLHQRVNLNDYPCWALMTKVALANDFNGRWVKTPDGYRLEDASVEPSIFAFSREQILWTLTVSLAVLFAASVVLVIVRRRRVKQATN